MTNLEFWLALAKFPRVEDAFCEWWMDDNDGPAPPATIRAFPQIELEAFFALGCGQELPHYPGMADMLEVAKIMERKLEKDNQPETVQETENR